VSSLKFSIALSTSLMISLIIFSSSKLIFPTFSTSLPSSSNNSLLVISLTFIFSAIKIFISSGKSAKFNFSVVANSVSLGSATGLIRVVRNVGGLSFGIPTPAPKSSNSTSPTGLIRVVRNVGGLSFGIPTPAPKSSNSTSPTGLIRVVRNVGGGLSFGIPTPAPKSSNSTSPTGLVNLSGVS
jgi:hypothetical protein